MSAEQLAAPAAPPPIVPAAPKPRLSPHQARALPDGTAAGGGTAAPRRSFGYSLTPKPAPLTGPEPIWARKPSVPKDSPVAR